MPTRPSRWLAALCLSLALAPAVPPSARAAVATEATLSHIRQILDMIQRHTGTLVKIERARSQTHAALNDFDAWQTLKQSFETGAPPPALSSNDPQSEISPTYGVPVGVLANSPPVTLRPLAPREFEQYGAFHQIFRASPRFTQITQQLTTLASILEQVDPATPTNPAETLAAVQALLEAGQLLGDGLFLRAGSSFDLAFQHTVNQGFGNAAPPAVSALALLAESFSAGDAAAFFSPLFGLLDSAQSQAAERSGLPLLTPARWDAIFSAGQSRSDPRFRGFGRLMGPFAAQHWGRLTASGRLQFAPSDVAAAAAHRRLSGPSSRGNASSSDDPAPRLLCIGPRHEVMERMMQSGASTLRDLRRINWHLRYCQAYETSLTSRREAVTATILALEDLRQTTLDESAGADDSLGFEPVSPGGGSTSPWGRSSSSPWASSAPSPNSGWNARVLPIPPNILQPRHKPIPEIPQLLATLYELVRALDQERAELRERSERLISEKQSSKRLFDQAVAEAFREHNATVEQRLAELDAHVAVSRIPDPDHP